MLPLVTLDQGQCTVEGPTDNQDSSMAITGGAGVFLSIQGEWRCTRAIRAHPFELTSR